MTLALIMLVSLNGRLEFSSQHPHSGLKPPVIPVSAYFDAFFRPPPAPGMYMNMVHGNVQVKYPYT